MVKVCFGRASIAAAAHAQLVGGLGDGAFDSGAKRVLLLEFICGLALASRLQRLLL
jgi:hypothetical protein